MRRNEPLTTQISRRTFAKGTVAAAVGLGLSTGSAAAAEESADLVTGPEEEPIGSVSIAEENGSLSVTYALDDDAYEITETHLHVADAVEGIPTNPAGNPVPGHFEHSSEHEEGTDSVEHVVDVSDLGDELAVAAQAEVRTEIEEEEEEGSTDAEEEETEGSEDEEGADGDETGIDPPEEDADGEEEADGSDSEDEETGEEADEGATDKEEEPEYEYEDAWADGERISQPRPHPVHPGRFLGGGSWATYVVYRRTADESAE